MCAPMKEAREKSSIRFPGVILSNASAAARVIL